MNFLLLEAEELGRDSCAALRGRRARHLREVLGAEVGQRLRAGVVDGPLGDAEVLRVDDDQVDVRLDLRRQPAPVHDVLLLAAPRPKVLLRMLSHAAAMGFAKIALFRSWRVDKSWLSSRAFEPTMQREQLLLGLEQSGRTVLPQIHTFDRFKPMVEDSLPDLGLPAQRFVAHPRAATQTSRIADLRGPFALALGPDGGFVDYEVDKLQAAGFLPITMGPHALRTEAALAALWGQLALLRGD